MPNTINYNVLRERYLAKFGAPSSLSTTVITGCWAATESVHGKSRGPNRVAVNDARVATTLLAMHAVEERQAAERGVLMPEKPSDDVAQMLSRLGCGFSVGERIDDGRKIYRDLRRQIAKEQKASS